LLVQSELIAQQRRGIPLDLIQPIIHQEYQLIRRPCCITRTRDFPRALILGIHSLLIEFGRGAGKLITEPIALVFAATCIGIGPRPVAARFFLIRM
jgi:hypothetical protein